MKRIARKILQKAQKIKLLILDVDGVLTDGGIVIDDQGEEIKRFDVRDGHGIRLLLRSGIQVALITGRFSRVVRHRAKDLGIRLVYQKAYNKIAVYREIKRKARLKDQEIAYVGDDIVDLPVLRRVGLSVAVRGSWEGLKPHVDLITARKGGQGAVRELSEILLQAQGKWQRILKSYHK